MRSCPLPGCLILPGSSEKSEVTFLSLQSWSRLRAERLQGPLGDERAARDAVDGRGRADQPRVCRERGGGEVPGTSMSRLNIYPYIIVLYCYPPHLPGPGRAGSGAPRVPWAFQGSYPGCCGETGSIGVGLQNVGGGSQDPVTRCWECARRGGQTSARKLLPFFLLSVFLRGDI